MPPIVGALFTICVPSKKDVTFSLPSEIVGTTNNHDAWVVEGFITESEVQKIGWIS